jgi:hypothetical protein
MNLQNSQSASELDSDKDSRLKYVEMGTVFKDRASAVDLNCKLSQKSCERFALYLAKQKPKTPEQFEKVELLKDFVLKTSQANEEMMLLIDYMKGLIEDIATDSKVLIDGAVLRDKLKFQSDTIEILINQRDQVINDFSGRNKKDSQ